MDEPIEPPLPAPLTPPRKPCPDCGGSGKKPLKYLGEATAPCPSCAGSGTIEVVEEPLTPWQRRVEKLLAQILAYVEPGVARDEAEDKALGLARPHPPDDLKPMDCFELHKP